MSTKRINETVITDRNHKTMTIRDKDDDFEIDIYQPASGHQLNEAPAQRIKFDLSREDAIELATILRPYV